MSENWCGVRLEAVLWFSEVFVVLSCVLPPQRISGKWFYWYPVNCGCTFWEAQLIQHLVISWQYVSACKSVDKAQQVTSKAGTPTPVCASAEVRRGSPQVPFCVAQA